MFTQFFTQLRAANVPVSLKEYLLLLEALDADLADKSPEEFYYLARAALVKDERHIDRFDQVFAEVFRGLISDAGQEPQELPDQWLEKLAEKYLTDEEKAQIEALGGWDKLMQTLKERLEEQKARHQGGSKWIGTAGTSPFGAYGYNPEGIRIGQKESRHQRAVKVWDRRDFKDFDDAREIGTRNLKIALRRLRKFARHGAADEFDLDATIKATATSGWLNVAMRPERRNAVKLLVFFDVGGSMDWHIRKTEELFSAVRAEFKSLNYYYFHNCLYERVWQDNQRRWTETTPTWEVLRTYPADTKIIFVGDASMSPYEIAIPGGSVEHHNDEAGAEWLARATATWDRAVWLNPVPQSDWRYTQSVAMVADAFEGRMFPLTLEGLDNAIQELL